MNIGINSRLGFFLAAVAGWSSTAQGYETLESDSAFDFEAAYVADVFSNLDGGAAKRTEYLGNLDLVLNIDTEQLWNLPGSSISIYFLGNHGGSISEAVGDAQGISNIEAPDSLKLYEATWTQSFSRSQGSVKMGLYDLNSEFDVIETAGLFVNSSFGIGAEYAQTGNNGPSIFPTTALAMRLSYQFSESSYGQFAVLEGTPGDPDDPRGTHIELSDDEGVLLATEIGYSAGTDDASPYRKFAVGGWRYSERFDDVRDVDVNGDPIRRSGNQGAYLLGEYQIFQKAGAADQGLNVFARWGFANDEINQLDQYWGVGAVYTGLWLEGAGDQLGLAIAHAHNGASYRSAQALAGEPAREAETTVELSYRAQLNEWLAIQPDLQWVNNPGMNADLDNAFVAGIRLEFLLN